MRIGAPFERDKVTAHLEDGLLRVELPKSAPPTARSITIESESQSEDE